jgi:hypothetical protein
METSCILGSMFNVHDFKNLLIYIKKTGSFETGLFLLQLKFIVA